MIQFVINSQKEGDEKTLCKYILRDLGEKKWLNKHLKGKINEWQQEQHMCNVEIDCKKIKHGAYGKIAIFYVFCSQKHMAPNWIEGYYSIRRFSWSQKLWKYASKKQSPRK